MYQTCSSGDVYEKSTIEGKTTVMNEIRVVGAAIIGDGRCFAALRGPGRMLAGYWEFPGGKVEAGESDEVALIREIREELGVVVRVDQCLGELVFTLQRHKFTRSISSLSFTHCCFKSISFLPSSILMLCM
jgi:8-oxo-dGTP diphosphatase